MINIEEKYLEGIPYLEVIDSKFSHDKRPLVFFYHGFESTKDRNVQYAYLLAKQGNRVILPEVIHHGQRQPLSGVEMQLSFWKIIFQTIEEVEYFKNYFEEKSLILDNKIAIIGSSMGGMIVYGALVKYPWLTVGASLMGMPAFVKFANHLLSIVNHSSITEEIKGELLSLCNYYDITLQLDKLNNRPLFIWHGVEDKIVPVDLVQNFWQNIVKLYNGNEDKIFSYFDETAGHAVTNEGVYLLHDWMDKNF